MLRQLKKKENWNCWKRSEKNEKHMKRIYLFIVKIRMLFIAVVVCIGLQVHPNKLNLCNLILCEKRYIRSVGMGFISRRGVYTEREREKERQRERERERQIYNVCYLRIFAGFVG